MTRYYFAKIATGVAVIIFMATGFKPAAADYPERPIRLIVPYPAGGGADIVTRHFALLLEKALGQPLVIENVAGGGGTVGTQRVATAAGDGYTLLIGGSEMLIRNLLQPMPYDPFRDFTPIALIGSGPNVVVGKWGLPAATIDEVLAIARNKPGALSYGSGAPGSPMHLTGEALKSKAGVDIRHIPYRGASPVLADIMSGQIDLGVVSLASAQALIDGGQVRAYAVTSLTRAEFAPKIPALSESSALAGMNLGFWQGLLAPANLPVLIRTKLETKSIEALDDPGLKTKLAEQAFALRKLSGQEFNAFLLEENEKYKKIIEEGRIKIQ